VTVQDSQIVEAQVNVFISDHTRALTDSRTRVMTSLTVLILVTLLTSGLKFTFVYTSVPILGPTEPPHRCVQVAVSRLVKRQERVTKHLLLSSAEI
jgi:hypothetical protein